VSELDGLDPLPEQVKLVSGTTVLMERLHARQFFKLLRILTHGALPVLQDGGLFELNADTDVTEFGNRLLSVLLVSIPNAEDETIEFVRSMCRPVGLVSGRKLNKQDTERNAALWAVVDEELDNPALDDLVTIVEAVVRRESEDVQALGKRLAAMFGLAQKTGQLPASLTPSTRISSADLPEPSTSSPPSTDGPTTSSADSLSADSASVSPPSESAAPTDSGTGSST
jgi:hypothetical protein